MIGEPQQDTLPITEQERSKLSEQGLDPESMSKLRQRAREQGPLAEDPEALKQLSALKYALLYRDTEQQRNPAAAHQARLSQTLKDAGQYPTEQHEQLDTPQALLAAMKDTYRTLEQELRGQPKKLMPNGTRRATIIKRFNEDTSCIVDLDDSGQITVTFTQRQQYPISGEGNMQPPVVRTSRQYLQDLRNPLNTFIQPAPKPIPESRRAVSATIRPSGFSRISETTASSQGEAGRQELTAVIKKSRKPVPEHASILVSRVRDIAHIFAGQ